MTVGRALAERTGLRLFHNHHSIDLALRFFPFGTESFHRLVRSFRERIFEEVAASDLPGLIFTYVRAFDLPSEEVTLDRYAAPFRARGSRVLCAELAASREERLRRNETALRLAEKPHMRDVAASRARLIQLDADYRLNSGGEFDGRDDYLRIDNTALEPEVVAEMIVERLGLGWVSRGRSGGG